jgi:hypothetical protein
VILPHFVRIAEHIVDESHAVEILLKGMNPGRLGRPPNGHAYRLFHIGGLLSTLQEGDFTIRSIFNVLVELDIADQIRLGFRTLAPDGAVSDATVSESDFYNISRSISQLLGYCGDFASLPQAERERRRGVLRQWLDALADVFELGWEAPTFAVDTTGIWAWGKGKRSDIKSGIDPDPDEVNTASDFA